jgi:hypothetical protein
MEAIRLQLLVIQYRPLGQKEPNRSLKFRIYACPQVEKALRQGGEHEDCLKQAIGHENLLIKS